MSSYLIHMTTLQGGRCSYPRWIDKERDSHILSYIVTQHEGRRELGFWAPRQYVIQLLLKKKERMNDLNVWFQKKGLHLMRCLSYRMIKQLLFCQFCKKGRCVTCPQFILSTTDNSTVIITINLNDGNESQNKGVKKKSLGLSYCP